MEVLTAILSIHIAGIFQGWSLWLLSISIHFTPCGNVMPKNPYFSWVVLIFGVHPNCLLRNTFLMHRHEILEEFPYCTTSYNVTNTNTNTNTDCINTYRHKWNGRHFADDTFKCISLTLDGYPVIEISLKIVLGLGSGIRLVFHHTCWCPELMLWVDRLP